MAGKTCLNAMTALQEQWASAVTKEFAMDAEAVSRLRKCLDMGEKAASKGPGRPKGNKKASTKSDAPTCLAAVWNNGTYNDKACCGKKSVGDDGHGHALCKNCLKAWDQVKASARSDGCVSYGKNKNHPAEVKWYGMYGIDPAPVYYEGPDYATKAARSHGKYEELKDKDTLDSGKGFDMLSQSNKRIFGAWHKPLTSWPGCEMPIKGTEAEVVVKSVISDMVEEAMSQSDDTEADKQMDRDDTEDEDKQMDRDDTVAAEDAEEMMFDKVAYKVVTNGDTKYAYPSGDWYKGKLTWDITDTDDAFAEVEEDGTLEFSSLSIQKVHDVAAMAAQ